MSSKKPSPTPPTHPPRVPFLQAIPEALDEIAHVLQALTDHWNVIEIVTASPESRRQEKETFIDAFNKGKRYHPQFQYPIAEAMESDDAERTLEELLAIVEVYEPSNAPEHFAVHALTTKIHDDLATAGLIRGIKECNESSIGHALRAKYQGTDPFLLGEAQREFQRRLARRVRERKMGTFELQLRDMEFRAEAVKHAFEWALQEYGLLREEESSRGFQVVIDENTAFIDVRDKSLQGPTVFIPADEYMTGDELMALIAHEIDAHARQTVNGELLLGIWNRILRVDDETLYEGLAMRYENNLKIEKFGVPDCAFTNMYTFAVRRAERGDDFHDIFADQFERRLRIALGIPLDESVPVQQSIDPDIWTESQDLAWRTTYRVMRGHVDTSNPHSFAMAKDLAYLRGWLMDGVLSLRNQAHLNECGIMTVGALQLLGRLNVSENDVRIPYRDIASAYTQRKTAQQVLEPASIRANR